MSKTDEQLKHVSASLDEQAVTCVLSIDPGFEPDEQSCELCLSVLTEIGIVLTAEIRENVADCISRYGESPERTCRVTLEATRPIQGDAGWFEWAVEFDPALRDKPVVEHQAIDFYNQSRFVCVEPGEVVGRIHPPGPGIDGVNLLGLVVPALDGLPAPIKIEESFMVCEDGEVTAQVAGSIEYESHTLRISQELDIHGSVDFGTGNIDFDGKVTVRGGIRDNFKVMVRDDLHVSEVIEAAQVQVGRDLFVSSGVTGHDKATLKVGRHAQARYMRQAIVRVGRDLRVHRELVNCDTMVGGSLFIPSGDLVGGVTHVLGAVHLATLGSDGGIATEIHLASSPAMEHQIRRASAELAALETKLEPVADEIAELRKGTASLSAHAKERLTGLSAIELGLSGRATRMRELLLNLRAGFARLRKVELRVKRVIYPGTRVVVGDVIADIDCGLKGPVSILHHEKRGLIVRDQSGSEMPLSSIARMRERKAA